MKTTKNVRLAIFALALCSAVFLTACSVAKNSDNIDSIAVKTSEQGIKYKLVKIEGKTFVATQSAYNYWTLAGPIDRSCRTMLLAPSEDRKRL